MDEVDPRDVSEGWGSRPVVQRVLRLLGIGAIALHIVWSWAALLNQGHRMGELAEANAELRGEIDRLNGEVEAAMASAGAANVNASMLKYQVSSAFRLHEQQFRHTAATGREVCWTSDIFRDPIPDDSLCPMLQERGAFYVGADDIANGRARRPPANRGARRAD